MGLQCLKYNSCWVGMFENHGSLLLPISIERGGGWGHAYINQYHIIAQAVDSALLWPIRGFHVHSLSNQASIHVLLLPSWCVGPSRTYWALKNLKTSSTAINLFVFFSSLVGLPFLGSRSSAPADTDMPGFRVIWSSPLDARGERPWYLLP